MRNYQIISDSACDLPQALARRYRIRIIPFYVSFNQKTYLKEQEEIGIPEFYSILNEGRIILDISGEEKKHLTRKDLLDRFAALSGTQEETDAVLLS